MSKGKIMIVEDDEDLVQMLKYNLGMRGYESAHSYDGVDACRLIAGEHPDLVLLDIMLPGLSGWQICKFIRDHHEERVSDIPIIMLTALGSRENKLRGIEMGADDYIPKPFSIREVMLKVERLMGREGKKNRLKAQIERFETKETRRTDFQGMLFHELKNQLSIIGGFSNRMVENPSLSPEKYRHCAGVISECTHSLSVLADEVLALLRIESHNCALPAERVSVKNILRQLVSGLSKQAQEKGMTIRLDAATEIPPIYQNAAAVKLAIGNLMENAVKYGPKHSTVSVRIESQRGKEVVVSVRDEGPGIAKEDQPHIFDKFYRGKKAGLETKGLGLGLHISKTLTEFMGGTIALESSRDSGTRFTVTLPVMQPGLN